MGAFDPKDLRVGDVVRLDAGAALAFVLSGGQVGCCDIVPDADGFIVDYCAPQELAFKHTTPGIEARWLSRKDQLCGHITRVERGGVQIYPPPECPFKKGDRVRYREHPTENPETVIEMRYVSWAIKGPYWQVVTDGGLHCPDEFLELVPVPEPPAFKQRQWYTHPEYGWVLITDVFENDIQCICQRGGLRGFSTKMASEVLNLKPYEPPVGDVMSLINKGERIGPKTCWTRTAADFICDRYILIEKDKP